MDDKINAIARHLGVGNVPRHHVLEHLRAGTLVECQLQRPEYSVNLGYAWRGASRTAREGMGLALQWWLTQLSSTATRQALLQGAGRGR
jgi:DNA-binding transcriptional LysR family regulator